jgi:UDP-N-acetylglucosamine--N-acetylmuramyl-(pentapeptide) pyrophosphoryl-undecaprenol N-acetylglucosamine transferase
MKVLLTGGGSGGHVSPALAVAQRLRRDYSDVELLYVGGSLTMEGSTGVSLEEQLVRPTGISLKIIHAGKLKRGGLSWSTLTRLWGVVPGMFEAWRVVGQFKPQVVFSSGGYVSLPVVVAAWLRRVPVVVHEQTAAVGLANALAGKLAKKVAVTFAQSTQYFAAHKVVVTGNPLQPSIVEPDMQTLRQSDLGKWLTDSPKPALYITGGGLGSHIINTTIEHALPELIKRYRIIHQCGAHAGFNDYNRLHQLFSGRDKDYWLAKHFSAEEVGFIYASVVLVIARAGANTVLELAALGQLAILIPIPWVTHDEQTKNAQVLVEVGTGVILPEGELTPDRLCLEIDKLMARSASLEEARQRAKLIVDRHATDRLVTLVLEVGGRENK